MLQPVSAGAVARVDRRHVRRAETIEQLVDVAVEVMSEHGVAGLTLGEVARRMGMRTPSLYGYFDSKNAVYDAVFARGWREVLKLRERHPEPERDADLPGYLLNVAEDFTRWSVEHPVYSQLMIWRPVPGYEPSADAYQLAVADLEQPRKVLARMQRAGLFRGDVPVDELVRVWTAVTGGVISQQLANAPHEPYESGSFTTLLPQVVSMYCAHYAPVRPQSRRRGRHGSEG